MDIEYPRTLGLAAFLLECSRKAMRCVCVCRGPFLLCVCVGRVWCAPTTSQTHQGVRKLGGVWVKVAWHMALLQLVREVHRRKVQEVCLHECLTYICAAQLHWLALMPSKYPCPCLCSIGHVYSLHTMSKPSPVTKSVPTIVMPASAHRTILLCCGGITQLITRQHAHSQSAQRPYDVPSSAQTPQCKRTAQAPPHTHTHSPPTPAHTYHHLPVPC